MKRVATVACFLVVTSISHAGDPDSCVDEGKTISTMLQLNKGNIVAVQYAPGEYCPKAARAYDDAIAAARVHVARCPMHMGFWAVESGEDPVTLMRRDKAALATVCASLGHAIH